MSSNYVNRTAKDALREQLLKYEKNFDFYV